VIETHRGDGGALPPFFADSLQRLPFAARLLAAVLIVGSIAVAGRAALTSHPNVQPTAEDVQASIAQRLSSQAPFPVDRVVVGDFLIERFYILDLSDGQRYVADLMKGQIEGIETIAQDEGHIYVFLLDRRNMRRERELYSRYVARVAPLENPNLGYYLGMITPEGMKDAFPVNFSGYVPPGLPLNKEERDRRHEDIHAYMLKFTFSEVSANAHLVTIDGITYLLSNSERFPWFGVDYGISRAVFLSELLVVDATSAPARSVFWEVFERPTRRVGR
jgi:hypothetical protein